MIKGFNQYFECTIEKATNELDDELRAIFLDFCLFLKMSPDYSSAENIQITVRLLLIKKSSFQ